MKARTNQPAVVNHAADHIWQQQQPGTLADTEDYDLLFGCFTQHYPYLGTNAHKNDTHPATALDEATELLALNFFGHISTEAPKCRVGKM